MTCSQFGGVIDGNDPSTYNIIKNASTLSIDTNCLIKNWPQNNGLGGFPVTNINFNFPQQASYYIVFDNVYYPGLMSCNNPTQSTFWIYWAPGGYNNISAACQTFMVPVDAVIKQNPPSQTTAAIGVPFTYTITAPYLGQLDSTGTFNYVGTADSYDITNVVVTDDLTQGNTAALSYVSNNAYLVNTTTGTRTSLGSLTPGASSAWLTAHPGITSDSTKHLVFSYEYNAAALGTVPAGYHIEIDLTVVLDNNTTANAPGVTFTNTVNMWFNKTINSTPMVDLQAWPSTTPPMTIVAPNLVVTKTGTGSLGDPTLNLGQIGNFTIDVQNTGNGDAWNATILDQLPYGTTGVPPGATGGMCNFVPQVTSVTVAGNPLTLGTDYSLVYTGPTGTPACQLIFTMLSPAAKIGPGQHLAINYQAKLDGNTQNGITLTNVAVATQWFNGSSSSTGRLTYTCPQPYNGTLGVTDCQDAHSLAVLLSGYWFEKEVSNVTTGVSPTKTAGPGNTLHYKLTLKTSTASFSNVEFYDQLPANFDFSTLVLDPLPAGAVNNSNLAAGLINIGNLSAGAYSSVSIGFTVSLLPSLTSGTVVSNQAELRNTGSTATLLKSDDPNDANGISDPAQPVQDPTVVTIQVAPAPLKSIVPLKSQATIGEEVVYQIKVPGAQYTDPLNNVVVTDALNGALQYVIGSATAVDNLGNPVTLTDNSSASNVSLSIAQIPAGTQVIITLHTRVANNSTAIAGFNFTNAASFTYTGGDSGPGAATPAITVVEPAVTAATKTVTNITNGKQATDPAAAGDILQYVVTIPNSGGSTAFDTNVVDTLPANVSLVTGSAKAYINGVAFTGFVVTPTSLGSSTVAWGRQNNDGSLDIPAGQSLVLTYQVTVASVNGLPIINGVHVDWTSLQDAQSVERTGAGCPTVTAPNTYCYVPTPASFPTIDTTTVAKSVVSDTWNSGLSTGTDSIVRVGDTVDYRLALTLREGQLANVVVTDTLPAGLAFDSVVSINGDTTAPYSQTGVFSYADIPATSVPSAGQTGTVTWNLGTITNAVNNNAADNTLYIVYRARVVKNALAQAASTSQTNSVALSYTGNDPAAARLHSTTTIDARQPVMSTPTKTATGFTNPANVNIATDVMPFVLQSCNNGLAPAYSAKFTDVLASQMNEASMTVPSVTVGATVLNAGTDYAYTYDTPTRTMTFVLNTPVNPGECATINYSIGFRTDIAPDQTWTNSVTLNEYWSLATPTTTGQMYGPVSSTPFTMKNQVTVQPLTKSVASPASGVVTIGQQAVYTITVPGTAVNAALNNVVVTDTLNSALEYVSATAVDNLGNPVTLTDNSVAPGSVSLTIAQITAGGQVIITLNTRVANNTSANAGLSFNNTASYTYTGIPAGAVTSGTSGSLKIVEPLVTITKSVSPATAPQAGDILTYTVNLSAVSGTSYSSAYDLVLADTLGTGLAYVAGSSTINGAPVADPSSAGQTLTWPARDIAQGATVTVTYRVQVLNTVAIGQTLANSATARWTSLGGASSNERTGTGTPAYNDYFATATTALTVGDNTSLAKSRNADTYSGGSLPEDVRIGDFVDYKLTLGLQEGTTTGVVLRDVLPAGMVYDSLISITPASGSNLTYSVASQPAPGATGTLTWNLGTVVNAADGNPANDYLVVVYRARVLNNSALSQTPATQTLTNSASLSYVVNGAPATPKTASQPIYVQQPMLAVTKTATPAGVDTIIDANEVITYKVDIVNSGAAPAYDTVLTDTLPAGLRQSGVTTTSITLIDTATNTVTATLPNLAPTYNATTGVATWNFDTGVADAYTIPAGEKLHVEYQVKADPTLGAGLTLTNSAYVPAYYSFDNNAVPATGSAANRQVYGSTSPATFTLTTSKPGALAKDLFDLAKTTATIGELFKYRITVPAATVNTALHDVRILDDLTASTAKLRFVSVAKVSGSGAWTPKNTSTVANQLVIEDTAGGIDIPAGQQAVIEITVQLTDAASNVNGLTFTNTANYTYNTIDNTPSSQVQGLPGTSPSMTVVEPTSLTLTKAGPTTMRFGLPGAFTLTVQNAGTSQAWDVTVTDLLPNPTPGGMCNTPPVITSAIVTKSGGPSVTLAAGSDYTTAFVPGAPTCTFTFTGLTAAAAIDPGQQLIINYQAQLDSDTPPSIGLTNIAGATQWFSQDTSGAGATGETRTYTRTLSDAATAAATLDYQDAHTVTTEAPVLVVQKTVQNLTTGQNPGTNAKPTDILRYTITINNISAVDVPNFSLLDDLGALNPTSVFVSGSLTKVTVPTGTGITNATNPSGGTNGAGLISFSGLSLGATGTSTASLTFVYDITLAPVLPSGIYVYNQAHLSAYGRLLANTDDPNVNGTDNPNVLGDEDPTRILIASAPVMQVYKTAQDMTGDATVLMPGDTLHYTISVKNVGSENASNVTVRDPLPANTAYVANSTRLNGAAVADPAAGVSALQNGFLIHAPEDATPGAMRADSSSTTSNQATITFDVVVNGNASDGTIISNQGFVNGAGTGGTAFPQQPSDDPATKTVPDDPTVKTVVRPDGIVYDSISRQPLAGVTLKLLRASTGLAVPASCFNDPAQQGQVTTSSGYYKFDLNFSSTADCPADADYLIQVFAAPAGYVAGLSQVIPPTTRDTTPAYSVPICSNDAVPSTTTQCEAQAAGTVPTGAAATTYYLHLTLGNNVVDNTTTPPTTDVNNQIFNNHIPIDPTLNTAISITKTTPLVNVTRGQQVPYTITVSNKLGGTITGMTIVDAVPPGFKYVEKSARFDTVAREPVRSGRDLRWDNVTLATKETHTIKLLLIVGSGVSEGEYVNQAQATSTMLPNSPPGIATATVRVVPDPTFDCTDIIGKVFDDANLNGIQDGNEKGLAGVRVVSARGLIMTTDQYGRFHVTCAAVPNELRGSNFILKVDERSLPSGYRLTTDNPLVHRLTRGKAVKFNFGATIERVVRLDIADGVFEPGTTTMRPQWESRLDLLLEELRKGPAVLRLSYVADVEEKGLVKARLNFLQREMRRRWEALNCCYRLVIESETFWRRGAPAELQSLGK